MTPFMRLAGAVLLWLLANQVALAQSGTNDTPLAVTEYKTASGILFRHVAKPDDSHHAVAFAFPDHYTMAQRSKEGVGLLGARLMLESTEKYTRTGRSELLKDIQSSDNFAGADDAVTGQILAPAKHFAEATSLFAEVFSNPHLSAVRLERVKRNVLAAGSQSHEDTSVLANQLYNRLTYGNTARARYANRHPSIYETVTKEDIEAWRNAVIVRSALIVTSAGPMPPEDAARHIDTLFGALPMGKEIPSEPAPVLNAVRKLVVLERSVVQAVIQAGNPTAPMPPNEQLPSLAALRVLGGSFTGRLVPAVREQLGAAYGISAQVLRYGPGTDGLVIKSPVDSAKAIAAVGSIRDVYARFIKDGVTDAEFASAKQRMIAESRESIRRSIGAAQFLRDRLLRGRTLADSQAYFNAVEALTLDAVNTGLRKRLPGGPLTIVVVAPSANGLGADCVIKSPDEIARCE